MPLFDPAPGALPNGSSVAFLAQRDVQLNTPVNFCTYPGVALTAACFPNRVYEEAAAATCISNLLVMGFRRVNVDLYWDVSQSIWSLCPVQLPRSLTGVLSTSVSKATSLATATSLDQTSIHARGTEAIETVEILKERRTDATPANPTDTAEDTLTAASFPSSTAATISATSLPNNGIAFDGTVADVGPFSCSPSLNMNALMGILNGYLENTETNLNATILALTLNIHAASPASDPTGSAQRPSSSELPQGGSALSSILQDSNSVYLFSPDNLASGRQNLNGSDGWYSDSVERQNEPSPAYFRIENDDGRYFTPDGWPSESYIALTRSKRLLVQFGNVDPQMAAYDFQADAGTIYPAGYLDAPRDVTTSSNGTITTGCFFSPGITELSRINSSWATHVLGSGGETPANEVQPLMAQTANITACGISPILNSTLNSATADTGYESYHEFVRQTIWSWGPGQPVNSSSNVSAIVYRCAALNAHSGYWESANCDMTHYGACHNSTRPYIWAISSATGDYTKVSSHCPANTTFDVPRNALENAYLLAAWREHRIQSVNGDDDDDPDPLLWLDFNDRNVNACWVIGQNSTCPYQDPSPSITRRVVVSTVSGVIVFLLAALLVLVKCAGNHQNSKRKRRRGNDGWDYEGVPS